MACEAAETACVTLALFLSFLGLFVRVMTVGFVPAGTSGRNARDQRAETLNTTGIYATVRNPLYLGNFLMLVGFVVAFKSLWFVLLTCLVFAVYYERIIFAEEAFLEEKFGERYRDWAACTPAFFPRPGLWSSPALTFSLRTVMKRENQGCFLIALVFAVIALAEHVLVEGRPPETWVREDLGWVIFLLAATLLYLVLRTLKKHTKLLRVAGR